MFLFLLIFLQINLIYGQVDQTLLPKAYGRDVVEATMDKIQSSPLGNDWNFAFRIAYAETKFGQDRDTFPVDYFGGIWGVDERIYLESKNRSPGLYAIIQNSFGIDWQSTTWEDCLKPLYSALVTILYFGNVNIPITYEKQADLWKEAFNNKLEDTKEKYISGAELLDNDKTCEPSLDFVTVLDASGSIGSQDFVKAKAFVGEFVSGLYNGTSEDKIRDAYVVFSTGVVTEYDFISGYTLPQKLNIIANTRYHAQMTDTGLGVFEGINCLNRANDRPESPKVMGIFTDGGSTNVPNLQQAIEATKNNNIMTISIGIGTGINRPELLMIAHGHTERVFEVPTYNDLQHFLKQFTNSFCKIPQTPPMNETVEDSLEQHQKRFYKIEIPEDGFLLEIEEGSGEVRGFYSFTVQNPNSAIHDGELDIKHGTFIERPSQSVSVKSLKIDNEEHSLYVSIEGMSEDTNNYKISTSLEGPDPALPCDEAKCILPNCLCSALKQPGNMDPNIKTPQFVLISFDGSLSSLSYNNYMELLENRKNPNGADISATFFVSHEYTDYSLVHQLYRKNHQISHFSLSQSSNTDYWKNLNETGWIDEVVGQRETMSHFAKIPIEQLKGFRAPNLQGGGSVMYKVLNKYKFEWDGTRPTVSFSPHLWPYTNNYASMQDCPIQPCSTASLRSFWTVPILSWRGRDGNPCNKIESCIPMPENEDEVLGLFMRNFDEHYSHGRAPFNIFGTIGWFSIAPGRMKGFKRFLDHLGSMEDVFIVTIDQMLEWVKNPIPLNEITPDYPEYLTAKPIKSDECGNKISCHFPPEQTPFPSERYMTQCQNVCPRNYPWLGNPFGL